MSNPVTQKLREFTVQIRHAESDAVVGTGIVVAPDGMIATCRHVVRDATAGGKPELGAVVRVRYAGPSHGGRATLPAKVVAMFPDSDDDVALLALERPLDLTADQVAVLGSPDTDGKPHDFKSFGFKRLDKYQAGIASGTIEGDVPAPDDGNYLKDPLQLNAKGSTVNRGMSGSGVLDLDLNLVVGLVSEKWTPDDSGEDRDTAWAVDARVLSLQPLGLEMRKAPLPRDAAPEPRTVDIPLAPARERDVDVAWNHAPSLPKVFVGRGDLLAAVADDWASKSVRVTSLVGVGGSGKSALARHAVQRLLEGPPADRPNGVFWWGFHGTESPDDFLEAMLTFISSGRIDPQIVSSSSARAQVIGAMLGSGRYLIVLDNLENVQSARSEDYGVITSQPLAELMTYLASPSHMSHTIVTSRIEPLDLANYNTHVRRDVGALATDESVQLLRDSGVQDAEHVLDREAIRSGGLPFHLMLAANVLSQASKPMPGSRGAPSAPAAFERSGLAGMLDQIDRRLPAPQRAFMVVLSAFRGPVPKPLARLFLLGGWDDTSLPGLDGVTPDALDELLTGLVSHALCEVTEPASLITVHPLARAHYFQILQQHPSLLISAHTCAAGAFIASYLRHERPPQSADDWVALMVESMKRQEAVFADESIADLDPVLEAIHHSAAAGGFDMAWMLYRAYLQRFGLNYLWSRIGAYDTAVAVLATLFPDRDFTRVPSVTPESIGTVLNTAATALAYVGRLRESVALFRRSLEQEWKSEQPARVWINLGDTLMSLGEFDETAKCIGAALKLIGTKEAGELYWEIRLAQAELWTLTGKLDDAGRTFGDWTASISEKDAHEIMRFSFMEYLVASNQLEKAATAADLMADLYRTLGRRGDEATAHRILGEVAMRQGEGAKALDHLNAALSGAETGGGYEERLPVMTTHGRAVARFGDPGRARNDLDVALRMARQSGLRLSEIEALVAIGWAHWRLRDADQARELASIARRMCDEIGYYKGATLVAELEEELKQSPRL